MYIHKHIKYEIISLVMMKVEFGDLLNHSAGLLAFAACSGH